MATYLPDSNDYIAKTEAYTPDFKFLADVLGRRQDRYNSNYKHLNDLYSKVVHADMSHKDNIHKRDEYANLLVPKIQQLTGTDFSLQQNVDAAKALFKPFFEDKQIVRDIVWTKRFSDQMQKANQFRTSGDAKERDRYWQDGVDRLNFSMQDFKEGSVSEIMNHQLPEYVEDPDLIEKGIEYLMNYEGKGKKLEMTDVVFDPKGQWMTTMTNGTVLTQRPTGVVDKKTGQMITYNPAANILAKTILDDPIISRGYATKVYVQTRKFYEDPNNIQKYGSKEGAEKFYLQKIIDQTKKGLENENASEEEHIEKLEQTKNSAKKYLESYSKPNSQAKKTYDEAIQAIIIANKGIAKNNEIITNINREHKDLPEMRNIAYEAYMNLSINNDVMSAANEYAQTTMKVTERELNPLYKMKLEHSYKIAEQNNAHDNAKKLADYEKSLIDPPTNLFGGAGGGMVSGPGHASVNTDMLLKKGDLIAYNTKAFTDFNAREVRGPMFDVIEQMTTKLAAVWSDADKTVSPNGLNVSVFVYDDGSGWMKNNNPENKSGKMANKFLTWTEAKEYFLTGSGRNDNQLENKYKEMIYNYQNASTDNVSLNTPEFNELRNIISKTDAKIQKSKAEMLNILDEQNAAYGTAYNMIAKNNPELMEFFTKNGEIGEMIDGKLNLHSLSTYQNKIATNWKNKIAEVNLPTTLKSLNDFKIERSKYSPLQRFDNDAFNKYLKSVFTPEVLNKLGYKIYGSKEGDKYSGYEAFIGEAIKDYYAADISSMKPPDYLKDLDPSYTKQWHENQKIKQKKREKTYQKLNNDYDDGEFTQLLFSEGQMRLQSNVANSELMDDTKKGYMAFYDAMNKIMTSSTAGTGNPTYNVNTGYMGGPQINDGSVVMTSNWYGNFIVNNQNPEVRDQLMAFFSATQTFDKSQIAVKIGGPEDHWKNDKNSGKLENKDWSENMQQLLNQIAVDVYSNEKDGAKPNMHITYNENINGMNGLILQLDHDYIKKLKGERETNMLGELFEESENTITIYVDKGLINNPFNSSRMKPSKTNRIINEEGKYYFNVEGGGSVTAWRNSQGGIDMQMIEKNWANNKYVDNIGSIITLPNDQSKIDEMMLTVEDHLRILNNDNIIKQAKREK